MLEQTEEDDHIVANTMKQLQLVNKHWSSWATRSIEILRPANVSLRTLLTIMAEKFVNLRSLMSENIMEIGDEELVSLGMLSTLKCLNLSSDNICFIREKITVVGVSSLVSLHALKELDLSGCIMITGVELQHLAPLTSLTQNYFVWLL